MNVASFVSPQVLIPLGSVLAILSIIIPLIIRYMRSGDKVNSEEVKSLDTKLTAATNTFDYRITEHQRNIGERFGIIKEDISDIKKDIKESNKRINNLMVDTAVTRAILERQYPAMAKRALEEYNHKNGK